MDRVSFTARMYNRFRHILFSGFGTSLGKVLIIILSAALECAKKNYTLALGQKELCTPAIGYGKMRDGTPMHVRNTTEDIRVGHGAHPCSACAKL